MADTLVKKKRFPIKHIVLYGFLPSPIKKWVYRRKGYRIGKNVSLGLGAVIVGKDVVLAEGVSVAFFTIIKARKIKIDRFVKIGATTYIDTERLEIGEDSRINEQVFVGGLKTPESALILGKRTIIMQLSFINPTLPITIGDGTGIGGHCLLFTHGSWNNVLDGYPVTFAPITLGKNVWLPWRVFINPGVTVGDGAVIGANSLVNKDVPANSLVAGSPAKIIKEDLWTPMPRDKRVEKIKTLVREFSEYLQYFDYTVKLEETDTRMDLQIKKEDTPRLVTVLFEKPTDVPVAPNAESCLVFDTADLKADQIKSLPYPMILDLTNKVRKGTTACGEEFASFFSRYGIRFDRLD